ncbi:hypothetical protein WISP_68088 [Willisornis vidua]|uniref:Uncharacterized protein n=1 Tax=Willisornis vidua TaxID=1566151 RepID=A0ABQ9DEA2_9PASS|nr:hypothetical protein WISP_68088 [Willisornis vidua]
MPTGFKTDPLLAKAKPNSDSGNTSKTKLFKKGEKKMLHIRSWERRVRGTALQTPGSVKKDGEVPMCQSRDGPAVYGEANYPPGAHRCPWWSRYPFAARGGPHVVAG